MALFIIDGVPGAGKTLNTIKEVRDRAVKEARPVFYNYITDLSPDLGWTEVDDDFIKSWHDQLPEGAILVIDEAWRHFPKWETKKTPPDYVLAFFQHRKKGHDVYLIVQSARVQIDPVVYENTEAHIHFQRVAGSQLVKRLEWNGSVGNPKAASSIASAKITYVRLDPSIFALYKSAEIHTHKFRPPLKFLLAILFLFFAIGMVFYNSVNAANRLDNRNPPQFGETTPHTSIGSTLSTLEDDKTALELSRYVPRVPKLPWTAPVYDALRQPKSFPRPAACIISQFGDTCSCYTQQATPLTVPDDFCRQYVKAGYFDDQLPDRPINTTSLP